MLAVEAQQAADQEDYEAKIRVPAEQNLIDGFAHDASPYLGKSAAGRLPARIWATSRSLQLGAAAGPKRHRLLFPLRIERGEIIGVGIWALWHHLDSRRYPEPAR